MGGGNGSNVFYNNSTGSDCFIWIQPSWAWQAGTINTMPAPGDGDGHIWLCNSGVAWIEATMLAFANYTQRVYDVIGTCEFFLYYYKNTHTEIDTHHLVSSYQKESNWTPRKNHFRLLIR